MVKMTFSSINVGLFWTGKAEFSGSRKNVRGYYQRLSMQVFTIAAGFEFEERTCDNAGLFADWGAERVG